jgi:Zn finger protein HypA/HybF involved in hydrogenase expression
MESTMTNDLSMVGMTGCKPFERTTKSEASNYRCPYCGSNLAKIVSGLKGNVHGQEFHEAYMHIHFECVSCKHELSEKYVNAYGNWNKEVSKR